MFLTWQKKQNTVTVVTVKLQMFLCGGLQYREVLNTVSVGIDTHILSVGCDLQSQDEKHHTQQR